MGCASDVLDWSILAKGIVNGIGNGILEMSISGLVSTNRFENILAIANARGETRISGGSAERLLHVL